MSKVSHLGGQQRTNKNLIYVQMIDATCKISNLKTYKEEDIQIYKISSTYLIQLTLSLALVPSKHLEQVVGSLAQYDIHKN